MATARQKCFDAFNQTGCRLALASEGSFGRHPVFYAPVEVLQGCNYCNPQARMTACSAAWPTFAAAT
ncbi:DUF6671 family protein [Cnuella takakiae]|nr:hypothetical protein BUE76_20165 [Cnuella takakiae]